MRRLSLLPVQLLSGFAAVLSASAQAPTPPPLLARPSPATRPSAVVTLTGDDRWKFAISHPKPEYPAEARRRHLSGKGIFQLTVSYDTGDVTSVAVLTSTGYQILDRAAVNTLGLWKFRPRTIVGMKVPITFSLSKKSSEGSEKT
jgi:TonB family protein